MTIRESVPNPDQSAVVEGETAPTDAEVGMPPSASQVPADAETEVERGADRDLERADPDRAGGAG